MTYIPEVKKRLEELKPGWMNLTLSKDELFELYDLLDIVILEARKSRSAHLPERDKPEIFLLVFLDQRIEIEIKRFFKEYVIFMESALSEVRDIEKKKKRDVSITETSTFREWRSYAQQIIRTIILGDGTERRDRKREIELYEKIKGQDAGLLLNSRRIYSYRDKLLGQEGTHKNMEAVRNHTNLEDAAKAVRHLDWEDMVSRWKEIEGMKGDGFFLKDIEAVRVAEQYARQFKQLTKDNPFYDEPTGYVPGYKRGAIRELIFLKKFAEDALNDWRLGEYPEIKTEQECIAWIESPQMIGRSMSEVSGPIETNETRPNFILYTFGNNAELGKLSWRLMEFANRLREQLKPHIEIPLDQAKPARTAREIWEAENDDSEIKAELCEFEFKEDPLERGDFNDKEMDTVEYCTADDFQEEEKTDFHPLRDKIRSLLTDRQQEIFSLYFIDETPVIEIAQICNSSRQNIYNQLNKILEKINNTFKTDLKLSSFTD